MRFMKIWTEMAPAACALVILMSAAVTGQPAKGMKADTAKAATNAKQLKPQTTCPVMGDAISKKLYVDHDGKRIYVCCSSCLAKVKKDPEKYIRKLEGMGQGVETIGKDGRDTVKTKGADHGKMKM
jgi:YHS domain-containing protein